jgi:predicted RNase H-like HicB family nuclease
MSRQYTAILERDVDNGFVASVPVLPGCVSQGDTRGEALPNIREAIDLYVEDWQFAGDRVPEEDSLEYVELKTGTRG